MILCDLCVSAVNLNWEIYRRDAEDAESDLNFTSA